MSRHRNIRNLTEDDYYDDGDYYDDDDYYYEEEEDDYEYQRQQQQQQQQEDRERSRAQAAAAAEKAAPSTAAETQDGPTAVEESERVRLVEGMGFSTAQARTALLLTGYDVPRAVEKLVSGEIGDVGIAPPPTATGAAPRKGSDPTRLMAAFDSRAPTGLSAVSGRPAPISEAKANPRVAAAQPKKVRSRHASPVPPSATLQQPARGKRSAIPPGLLQGIKDQRSRLSMVVLGHVDAGKSTLMGQVLLQLGHVQKRTVAKYERHAAELGKASFALAWVMDEDESERERGVTMDIGTKYATTRTHDLTILDAPGHADYVPAMITGAASADVGLLVVAAAPGEFESGFEPSEGYRRGGQTREHIILSRGLGVSQLIVAVNKLDAADPAWSQARFEEIKARVLPFLQINGFNPKRVRFLPVSGLAGVNVKDPPSDDSAALKEWYGGPTLLDAIDSFLPAQRKVDKPLRMIVSDLFSEGKGITARCRCVQGILSIGDEVAVLPVGDVATVARIDHGKALFEASPFAYAATAGSTPSTATSVDNQERSRVVVAGDSVDVVLTGIDVARIHAGNVLSHVDLNLRPPVRRRCQANLIVMADVAVPIIVGAQVLLHMHSLDIPATVTKLLRTKNRDGSIKRERPRVLVGGANAAVEIALDHKIPLEKYMECRALGRFVLRRGGDTVAVGVIEEVLKKK